MSLFVHPFLEFGEHKMPWLFHGLFLHCLMRRNDPRYLALDRAADTSAVHSLSPTTWLSGVRPKPTQGVDAYAGITADIFA